LHGAIFLIFPSDYDYFFRSHDGLTLGITSSDGYCSFVFFEKGEFGPVLEGKGMWFFFFFVVGDLPTLVLCLFFFGIGIFVTDWGEVLFYPPPPGIFFAKLTIYSVKNMFKSQLNE